MAEQSTVRAAVCLLCVLLTTMAFGWLASRVLTLERMVMQSGCLAPAREKETTVSPDTVTRTHQEMPKDLSPWSLQASMMGSTPSTMLRVRASSFLDCAVSFFHAGLLVVLLAS